MASKKAWIGGSVVVAFVLIVLTIGITAVVSAISDFISTEGSNVVDGVHIHKVLIAWILIGAAAYLRYEREAFDWTSIMLLLIGAIIYAYDILLWNMYLPITLV